MHRCREIERVSVQSFRLFGVAGLYAYREDPMLPSKEGHSVPYTTSRVGWRAAFATYGRLFLSATNDAASLASACLFLIVLYRYTAWPSEPERAAFQDGVRAFTGESTGQRRMKSTRNDSLSSQRAHALIKDQ